MEPLEPAGVNRRQFIVRAGLTAATASGIAALGLRPLLAWADNPPAATAPEAFEVTAVEDLMREHGVLRRVMLAQDEIRRRLGAGEADVSKPLRASLDVVKKFIQDYHEKLEEDNIFPRFEKADRLAGLVKILRRQHQAGRKLVEQITTLATEQALKDKDSRRTVVEKLVQFQAMYRPHAAREDTVLFPSLHSLMSDKDYGQMGDKFEDKEQELFGKEGFEKMVVQVEGIEKQLGISDLDKFTP